MKVFVAGATGAVGKRLVPLLVANGHEVIGTTRTETKASGLRSAGARPIIVDVLDREAVATAVRQAAPDVIVHQATALTSISNLRKFDAEFEATNRLRTQGTDNLLAAAHEVGVGRFVAQSFAGWPYARVGGPVKSEEDPLDPNPPPPCRRTLAAIRHLEAAVTDAGQLAGLVLRYGGFYGPGTSLDSAADAQVVEMVRRRRFPIVGEGTGIWSFVHIEDVAGATLAAITGGVPGIYNIVDDDPAPVSAWLPHLATLAGAKPPRRLPVWLGRLAAGDFAVAMMTSVRGASNAKARRELDWRPQHASWRQGFAEVFSAKRPGLATA